MKKFKIKFLKKISEEFLEKNNCERIRDSRNLIYDEKCQKIHIRIIKIIEN
jgi:hypothetical protein